MSTLLARMLMYLLALESIIPVSRALQSCCPPGSRLTIGSGFSTRCVNFTSSDESSASNSNLTNLIQDVDGYKLPDCKRGMQVELVDISNREEGETTIAPIEKEEEKDLVCKEPWIQLDTGCYLFLEEETRTWMEARDKCKEEGGYLVEVDTKEENDAIVGKISSEGYQTYNMEFWIGLNDLTSVEVWQWVQSGKQIGAGRYTDWASGEPNNLWSERCVHYNGVNKWNNRLCSETYNTYALCEKKDACIVEEGIDYPGMDLNSATGPTEDRQDSPLQCRAFCNRNPDCNFFGWKSHNKECWIKTSISRKVRQAGTTSGTACRTSNDCSPKILDATAHTGSDLPNMPYIVQDVAECFQLCEDHSTDTGRMCAGMTFREDNQKCYLHTNIHDSKIEYRHGHYFARNEPCNTNITTTSPPLPHKEYRASISSKGQLLISDKIFESRAFCLETTWQDDFGEHLDDGEAITLSCDFCKEEVLCTYLRKLYQSSFMNSDHHSNVIAAFIGKFNSFKELKISVEMFLKNVWELIDSDKDGKLNEILKKTEVRLSSNFLLKFSRFMFDKLDVDGDAEISALDWFELIGEKRNTNIGRRLVSLPSPIYKLYTHLDKDRNEGLSLEEIHNFLKRTFTLLDKNEDCLVDLTEVIAVLDESKLPKDFQLGVKQLAQYQLTLWNHALNKIFVAADSNKDNNTELEEILKLYDFDFVKAEAEMLLILGQPNKQLINYITHAGSYQEDKAKEIWLETFQNLMMHQMYEADLSNVKCG